MPRLRAEVVLDNELSPILVLLLGAAILAIAVLVWCLQRARGDAKEQRGIADRNEASALREQARQLAAHERSARAVEGEWGAPALLASAGYEVLAGQVAGSWTVRANGEPKTFGLRADYLVSRGGRRFIAEVKTGRLAPNLAHAPTRRQLLEYGAAFDVDGVLLVDADRETITHIEIDAFTPSPRGLPLRAAFVVVAVAFGSGILVGVVMTR